MGNSLFNITQEQKLLILEIESLEGEITPDIEERLLITENQLEQKSIAYLEVIRQKESYNSLIDAEIKRLQGLKKQTNNVIDKLEENLLNAVKIFGTYTVGTQKFSTRKSSQIIIDDVNSLPEKYKVIKVTESADKMQLKEALKNGEHIKGVYVQDNINLKIN
jgi:hypothetical protein